MRRSDIADTAEMCTIHIDLVKRKDGDIGLSSNSKVRDIFSSKSRIKIDKLVDKIVDVIGKELAEM